MAAGWMTAVAAESPSTHVALDLVLSRGATHLAEPLAQLARSNLLVVPFDVPSGGSAPPHVLWNRALSKAWTVSGDRPLALLGVGSFNRVILFMKALPPQKGAAFWGCLGVAEGGVVWLCANGHVVGSEKWTEAVAELRTLLPPPVAR